MIKSCLMSPLDFSSIKQVVFMVVSSICWENTRAVGAGRWQQCICISKRSSCSTSLMIGEAQLQTPRRDHFTWVRLGLTAMSGCHFLFQGIFPTQELNPRLLLSRQILYHWATWEACLTGWPSIIFPLSEVVSVLWPAPLAAPGWTLSEKLRRRYRRSLRRPPGLRWLHAIHRKS